MNFIASGFVDNGYFIRDSDTVGSFRFDGLGKKIFVNTGVTSITVESMYSRWCDWLLADDNAKFSAAIRVSGYDPIPGGFTGATFFLMNGWKLVYDANTVAVSGVLFSEDYATAYWSASGSPIYPATVSSVVNTSVGTSGSTGLTVAEIATAILAAAQITPIHSNVVAVQAQGISTSGSSGPTSAEIVTALCSDARFKGLLTLSNFLALKD